MGEFVRLEAENGVGTIRLDRPKLNAIGSQMTDELFEAAKEATRRDDVRAVVIWGGPVIFAAGADVGEMAELGPEQVRPRIAAMQEAINAIEKIPKVTIAAINGYALGGGYELALAADLRYAADSAKVGLPEIQLGIIPGAGGTQRLPRLIGPAKSKDLIYTGRQVQAEEALALGLVDGVFPAKEVYERAVGGAQGFSGGPLLALRAAKRAIDLGIQADLLAGLDIEMEEFVGLFATEDQKTGMRSLLEKGAAKAEFKGK
ncbi:MAG: enoyl-CoA hydratase-related protein [Actinomycetota bacterium]